MWALVCECDCGWGNAGCGYKCGCVVMGMSVGMETLGVVRVCECDCGWGGAGFL